MRYVLRASHLVLSKTFRRPHVSKYKPRQYSDYISGYDNDSCNCEYRDYDYRKCDYIERASSNQDCTYHKICNHDCHINNEKNNIDCNHETNLDNYFYSNYKHNHVHHDHYNDKFHYNYYYHDYYNDNFYYNYYYHDHYNDNFYYNYYYHDHYNDKFYNNYYYHDDNNYKFYYNYYYHDDYRNVTPNGLDSAFSDLDALRKKGIRHYGLLTVLSFQKDFRYTVRSTKGVLQKMKEIQHEETAKLVLAIGAYDFANIYRMKMKQGFRDAVKNLEANIVILIASAGWISPQGACVAAPPNPVKRLNQQYFDLVSCLIARKSGDF
ncbi:uncharacterized protein LOC142769248 isoform X1 [Rhipicephalus microplus]|uniref:uncharacterized protein LOC142769248 isoform X1 n=1 Tax=Rhipicephalus microplus TaxID=6941 RepID=UPI003F6C3723